MHGSKKEHSFDIEFGTMNNLTSDYSTVRLLEDSFKNNGINNIVYNNPFKGGAITQSLYEIKDVNAIQLEINRKFRDKSNMVKLKQLCDAFEEFINKYKKFL